MWSIATRIASVAAAMSLAFASPAVADSGEYLQRLLPFYTNLSVMMVQRDLGVSVSAAGDIVAAAVVQLDC